SAVKLAPIELPAPNPNLTPGRTLYSLYRCRHIGAVSGNRELALVVRQHADGDFEPLRGQASRHARRPFDKHQVWRSEVFLGAYLQNLVFARQRVGVDVDDGARPIVFVYQDKRGTDAAALVASTARAPRLYQPRLARA